MGPIHVRILWESKHWLRPVLDANLDGMDWWVGTGFRRERPLLVPLHPLPPWPASPTHPQAPQAPAHIRAIPTRLGRCVVWSCLGGVLTFSGHRQHARA